MCPAKQPAKDPKIGNGMLHRFEPWFWKRMWFIPMHEQAELRLFYERLSKKQVTILSQKKHIGMSFLRGATRNPTSKLTTAPPV